MVIVPTLFGSVAAVEEMLAHLEVHALGNPDPRLHFALLSDFTDADASTCPATRRFWPRPVPASRNSTSGTAV